MYKAVYFILLLLAIPCSTQEDAQIDACEAKIEGNWSILKNCNLNNMYLEIYIGEGTFNIFASDIRAVPLSSYYTCDSQHIYLLTDHKKSITDTLKYKLVEDFIELTVNDSLKATYKRYNKGFSLNDYLTDKILKWEYLSDFDKRHLKFKDLACYH